MVLSWPAVYVGIGVFVGYVSMSTLLQYMFYVHKRDQVRDWKIQARKDKHVGDSSWWLPLVSRKERVWGHWWLATVNITLGSLWAAMATEACVRGRTRMYWDIEERGWLYYVTASTWLPIVWQGVIEYYWHRVMHLPWFYRRFHKMHHAYKSPEPFDDMYIHPLEAMGYYCILYSPPFVFAMHWSSFVLYMIIHGLTGVLDHCGIWVRIPYLYDTRDHDAHHSATNVNYSFPLPFMDILHGTYVGEWLGFTFDATKETRVSPQLR